MKEEFAPSNKIILLRRQQAVQNLITPHARLLQFISSHSNANRLGSPHLRRTLHRMIRRTLSGLKATQGHPLTREIHLHIILFALRLLRVSSDLAESAKWRFKDRILSSALTWFSHPPRFSPCYDLCLRNLWLTFCRWSFGGNRLQIKAETRLIGDVLSALGTIAPIGSNDTKTLFSLSAKQEVLALLLNDEQMRLQVWLTPLDHESKRLFALGSSNATVNVVCPKVRWANRRFAYAI